LGLIPVYSRVRPSLLTQSVVSIARDRSLNHKQHTPGTVENVDGLDTTPAQVNVGAASAARAAVAKASTPQGTKAAIPSVACR